MPSLETYFVGTVEVEQDNRQSPIEALVAEIRELRQRIAQIEAQLAEQT